MSSNIFVRIVMALGVNAIAFGAYFGFARFSMADQSSLAQPVIERLQDDPAGLQIRIDDLVGQLIALGATAMAIAFIAAAIWLLMVEASPPVGDGTARKKRQPWAALLIVTALAVAGAGWLVLINAPIAAILASGIAVTGTAVAIVLAVIGYWVGTGISAPRSCKVAVPGFGG